MSITAGPVTKIHRGAKALNVTLWVAHVLLFAASALPA